MPLMRGERHLEDAVLARQRYGLAVLGPNRRIEFGAGVSRLGSRRVPCRGERKDDCEGAHDERAQDRPVPNASLAIGPHPMLEWQWIGCVVAP